jgi:hypothetical protein
MENKMEIGTDLNKTIETNSQISILRKMSHDNQHNLLINKHPKIFWNGYLYQHDELHVVKRRFELNLWDAFWDAAIENTRNKILLDDLLLIAESLFERSTVLLNVDSFLFYPDIDNVTNDDEACDDDVIETCFELNRPIFESILLSKVQEKINLDWESGLAEIRKDNKSDINNKFRQAALKEFNEDFKRDINVKCLKIMDALMQKVECYRETDVTDSTSKGSTACTKKVA